MNLSQIIKLLSTQREDIEEFRFLSIFEKTFIKKYLDFKYIDDEIEIDVIDIYYMSENQETVFVKYLVTKEEGINFILFLDTKNKPLWYMETLDNNISEVLDEYLLRL